MQRKSSNKKREFCSRNSPLPSLRIHQVQRPDNQQVPDNPDDEQGGGVGNRHVEDGREVREGEEDEAHGDVEGELLLGLVPGHEAHDDDEGREEEVREGREFESHGLSPQYAV
jgi:hypothetical protein